MTLLARPRAAICLLALSALALAASRAAVHERAAAARGLVVHALTQTRAPISLRVADGHVVGIAGRGLAARCSDGGSFPVSFDAVATGDGRRARTSFSRRYPDGTLAWTGRVLVSLDGRSVRAVVRLHQRGLPDVSCDSGETGFSVGSA